MGGSGAVDLGWRSSLKGQGFAKGQWERSFGLTLLNIAARGEPTIMANATCLRTIMVTITPAAVPAAIGMDRNNRSITIPLMLPAAANIAHFRCLLFIGYLSLSSIWSVFFGRTFEHSVD
jgi:hypothetical protein